MITRPNNRPLTTQPSFLDDLRGPVIGASHTQNRSLREWKISFAVGGFVGLAPYFGFLLMFLLPPASRFGAVLGTITMLGMPGVLFASAVLASPHGASMLGTLLIGVPFNIVLYALLCYGFIRALRI